MPGVRGGQGRGRVGSRVKSRTTAPSVEKDGHRAAFIACGGDERRVGGSQSLPKRESGGQGNAVGEGQGAPDAVIVGGVKTPRAQADGLIDGNDFETTEGQPTELFLDLGRRPALVPNKDVEHFGEVDRADPRAIDLVAQ